MNWVTKGREMKKNLCCACCVLVLAALFTTISSYIKSVYAGGFAVREQSVSGLGTSFAGIAVGSDLSSIYWNPAAATIKDGFNTESHAFAVFFENTMTADEAELATGGAPLDITALPGFTTKSGEYADNAVVAASYANYQLSQIDPNLYLGLAVNSPFGLVTKPDNLGGSEEWVGAFQGTTSELFTLNVNPNIAYKLSPSFSVGVGLQVQYFDTTLKFATPNAGFGANGLPLNLGNSTFRGDDIGAGVTAGFTWEPLIGTKIGFGYRSSVEHELDGTFQVPETVAIGSGVPEKVSVTADVETPDIFTVSARHALTPRLSILGTFEYTKWSDLDQIEVKFDNDVNVNGPLVLEFGWDDGWLVSGGVEYLYSEKLKLRFGGGFESSPIQEATQRVVQVPDSDRIWVSAGATYKFSETMTFDLAYTHIFVEDGDIDRTAALAPISLKGEAEADADIIGFSFKRKWGGEKPLPPLK